MITTASLEKKIKREIKAFIFDLLLNDLHKRACARL